MPEYTVPEIQRTSLTAVILTLKCLGVHDVIRYTDAHFEFVYFLQRRLNNVVCCLYLLSCVFLRFPYLDCPEERFILEALKQLYQYDAIDR